MMPDATPLAERMRPKTLDDYVGQQHLVGAEGPLRQALRSGQLPSLIFWGPPGVGKTTLARILAQQAGLPFLQLSAISSGVADLRKVIAEAEKASRGMVLFIDEIHRFNKTQQDALLGAVEKGSIKLIGATTENPSFEVNNALLSRCQIYVLQELSREELEHILKQALEKDTWLRSKEIHLDETEALLHLSGGDARKLLNLLELAVNMSGNGPVHINNAFMLSKVQFKAGAYDKSGEMHYDIISAFIKSMRGSDPNAAVYWLARMIAGGEDPLFIARRMMILAAEDIGLANPNALLLAQSCFQAVHVIGMPEARIILSETAVYLATSPKSNSTYLAIDAALELVRKTGDLPVPLHLRNAPTKLMKELNYGKDYAYAHAHEGNFVELEFMPEALSGKVLYEPGNNDKEVPVRNKLKQQWRGKYPY